MYSYSETEVAKIMAEQGLDRMQAINVCRSRNIIQRNLRQSRNRFGGTL